MPAAAVIPAPRVYTKAVAVKTLVVEFQHLVNNFWVKGRELLLSEVVLRGNLRGHFGW